MNLTMLAKSFESGKNGCPSVYIADDGKTAVIQGNILDDDTASKMQNVLPGEAGVSIDFDVLEAAVRRHRKGSA